MKYYTIKQLVALIKSESGVDIKYCRKGNHLYFYKQAKSLHSFNKEQLISFLKKFTETYEISSPRVTDEVVSFTILPSVSYISCKWYGKHPKMEGLGSVGWWIKREKTEVVRKRTSAPLLVVANNKVIELKQELSLLIPTLSDATYKVVNISPNIVRLKDNIRGRIIGIPAIFFQNHLITSLVKN